MISSRTHARTHALGRYSPFQAVYLVFLLMQWVGEGIGQLISLQLNASRQLAGGVAALIATVLTGSFPLLAGLGTAFTVLSWLSFCRWGMVALLSIEFAPWYVGEPTMGATPGCCSVPRDLVRHEGLPTLVSVGAPQHLTDPAFASRVRQLTEFLKGDESLKLPVHCAEAVKSESPTYPSSQKYVANALNESYGYTAWLPQWIDKEYSDVHWHMPDIYPLPHSHLAMSGRYTSADAGFSRSALAMLVLLGLVFRVLVYLSLRFMDRTRRR